MAWEIQEIALTNNNTSDVDTLADMLDTLLYHADASTPQLFLIDVRVADTDNLRQLILHIKEVKRLHSDQIYIYIALLIGDSVLADVVDTLLKTVPNREAIEHFSQRQKAESWFKLLQTKQQQART